MKILNFGSLNLDHVYQVEHFVRPGETLSAVSQTVNPGGKGLNQSVALKRAGADVYHAGCFGKGGEGLRQLLLETGVRTDDLRSVEELQGNAVIQVDRSGQNCILLFGGSNQCITKEQIETTLGHFESGDYLILQNEVNELSYMVDLANKKGLKIILNPSPFNEKLLAVDFGKLDWILVNEIECAQVSGKENPEEAWQIIHEKYPDLSVLITLGENGSMAFTGEKQIRQSACRVKAVDTTAAGDTYTGFFVAGLMKGLPLAECMKQASEASAISVSRRGAAVSIPTMQEVEEWEEEQ